MVEWFKAAVLKTAEGQPSVGSNPTLSAIHYQTVTPDFFNKNQAFFLAIYTQILY